MEMLSRRSNRLGSFDYGEDGCYFVTLCTHCRQKLFQTENKTVGNGLCAVPNRILRRWIEETENKYENVRIDQYVIMPDHLHLLVTIKRQHPGGSLPDALRFFKTMTTNEYIRSVKQGTLPPFEKKLWQKSYYDHVIRNQQDYNEVWEYIENNPLKWKLVHGQRD